ncbi:MAG: rhomboid family intramembrane serine protease, partial [Comamonadaceae bacterium]
MFYAIPLENKPSWRNPPWMTVLLILVNMAVFWGPQRSEQKALDRAAQFYRQSELPNIEFPAFVKWLEDTRSQDAAEAQRALRHRANGALLTALQGNREFMRLLHAEKIVTPDHPKFALWRDERRQYESMRPAPFTERWAQDYEKDAEWRPATWLTATFLHGSNGHLLG